VGFYSAYLVADKVTVISKSSEDGVQHRWESSAGGTFTIVQDDSDHGVTRGSKIVLTMKSDNLEFLEEKRLKDLIKKHSEFINFEIQLQVEKTTEKEIEDDDEEEPEEKKDEEKKEGDDVEIKEEKEEKVKKTKKVKEVSSEFEVQNQNKPIWMRKPETVTKEEYSAFYKALSNDWEDHLAVK